MKLYRAYLIPPSGDTIKLEHSEPMDLEKVRATLGHTPLKLPAPSNLLSYVEVYVAEEGLALGLLHNPDASRLTGRTVHGRALVVHYKLAPTEVLCDQKNV